MAKDKKKTWHRPRHKVINTLLRWILTPVSRIRYGVRVEKRRQDETQYLIMMNHQTPFDQFFVSMALPKQMVYYVGTEDLFSNGFISKVIRFAINPIPFKKSTSDFRAVKDCIRVAREGYSILLSPEGNRTYSGVTEHIKPSIATLARALKLPIAIFRIEGGFGVEPRWADIPRHGRMKAGISRVIQPEEYLAMSEEELFELIAKELYVDDRDHGERYTHAKAAEYLERVMYVCPHCGFAHFRSDGDTVRCLDCGMKARYLPDLTFESLAGDFPYRTVKQWYDAQNEFVCSRTAEELGTDVLYEDTVRFFEVILYKRKRRLSPAASLRLCADRIECAFGGSVTAMPFDEVKTVSVLGRNKLNIYTDNQIFQVKGDKRFNAVKYANLFYHYQNVQKGELHGEFLGL